MSDTDIKALFAAAPEEPVPPQPPDYVAHLVTLGRRSVRRRIAAVGALWTVIGIAVLAIAVPGLPPDWRPASPAAPASAPSLPDVFAGYSSLTAPVSADPAGRAIALYSYGNSELFTMFQPIVVGADRDTYRRVDAMQERGLPSALLSPDGTQVLLGDDRAATRDLVLVNLVSGAQREIDIGSPYGVRLLAWSPDGRYVAYSVAPVTETGLENSNVVDHTVGQKGVLVVLDVAAGTSTRVDRLRPASRASFAPDSQRLAVQVGQTVHVIDRSGREERQFSLPADLELAGNVAWSPDGTLFAVQTSTGDGEADGTISIAVGNFADPDRTITFIDATGATGPPRSPQPPIKAHQVLGWRSPTTMLTWTARDDMTGGEIKEVTIEGQTRTFARFSTRHTCELGTKPCQAYRIRLATGLLPQLTVRDAGFPRRGMWPWWLTVPLAATVVALALILRPQRRSPRRPRKSPQARQTPAG